MYRNGAAVVVLDGPGWDDVVNGTSISPVVQVLEAHETVPQTVVTTPAPPRSAATLSGNRAALTLLGSLVGVDAWVISRITEDTWTSLATQTTGRTERSGSRWAGGPAARYAAGTPIPVGRSLCHHLLAGPEAVVIGDLGRRRDPALQRLSAGWGVRGYIGIALTSPDGTRLGSLAGLSAAPLRARDRDWAALLGVQATALQAALGAEIAAVAAARRGTGDWGADRLDDVTGLPDRHGWATLLDVEEELSAPVGDPVGLALVDLGVIRTVRSLRRAVTVAREAAGDVQVARVGPRRLGILAGGHQSSRVSRMATSVQAHLDGAGFGTSTAHSMRAGLEPLSTTWSRVDGALVAARRR